MVHYNTVDEIDRLIAGLDAAIGWSELFRRLAPAQLALTIVT